MPQYISARQVRDRVGKISAMTLWRWLRDDRLGFPKPTIIQRRRYWREVDIDNWLQERALTSVTGGAK